jgi:hypothetical protein
MVPPHKLKTETNFNYFCIKSTFLLYHTQPQAMYRSAVLKLARATCQQRLLSSTLTSQTTKSCLIMASSSQCWQSGASSPLRMIHSTPRCCKSAEPVPVEDDESWRANPSAIKLKFREKLEDLRARAQVGGGEKRIAKQHARGSMTARERLELLFDPGSFRELDQLKAHRCTEFGMADPKKQFPGDGIVTGHGLVNGKCEVEKGRERKEF